MNDPSASRPRLLPPHWFLLALLATGLLAVLPGPSLLPMPLPLLGLIPVVGGIAVAVSASRLFDRAGTTILPFDESSVLVERGPFRWSRNPMYTSMVAVVLGLAVVLDRPAPFLVPALFLLILQRGFVRHEERMLRERFGDAYDAYCRRVRRWL
jgi:protein-S-isoprenylcysteine O-methyltransferase Ste14